MSQLAGLQLEWQTLQNQSDSYEKHALFIKLLSFVFVVLLIFHQRLDFLVCALCALLWVQEAIWKTYQSRIAQRLLVVEQALREQQQNQSMQFNTAWLASRKGALGLLGEYAVHLLKPTVAFPHAPLVALSGLVAFYR